MNESDLLKSLVEYTDDVDSAVELFRISDFVKFKDKESVIVIIPQDDSALDIEFIEKMARTLAKHSHVINVKLSFEHYPMPDHLEEFVIWAFKFFFYQEAEGDIVTKEIIDVFTSQFIPYRFNLEKLGVSRIIKVNF